MKTIAGVLIAAALAFACGCARTDWIERTLVTVDVGDQRSRGVCNTWAPQALDCPLRWRLSTAQWPAMCSASNSNPGTWKVS
jgi:hypothetical protein